MTAVDGVSFEVEPGTTVGLLGPNGAGKTTIIKAILGLVVPDEGAVAIHGVDPYADPRAAYGRMSAVLEGARNVYWRLSARENLRFFAGLQGLDLAAAGERHQRLLSTFGLADRADEPVRTLSRGMKQKVALACALARETPVVFLDEPTLGLDVEAGRLVREELQRLAGEDGRTLLVSSHDLDVVEDLCERVVILNDGAVVADDAVTDLVDLFRTRAYRLSLVGDARAIEAALEPFEVYGSRPSADGLDVEVAVDSRDCLYDLMDALRAQTPASRR